MERGQIELGRQIFDGSLELGHRLLQQRHLQREGLVLREGLCERLEELEHLLQPLRVDHVDVAVGERFGHLFYFAGGLVLLDLGADVVELGEGRGHLVRELAQDVQAEVLETRRRTVFLSQGDIAVRNTLLVSLNEGSYPK